MHHVCFHSIYGIVWLLNFIDCESTTNRPSGVWLKPNWVDLLYTTNRISGVWATIHKYQQTIPYMERFEPVSATCMAFCISCLLCPCLQLCVNILRDVNWFIANELVKIPSEWVSPRYLLTTVLFVLRRVRCRCVFLTVTAVFTKLQYGVQGSSSVTLNTERVFWGN